MCKIRKETKDSHPVCRSPLTSGQRPAYRDRDVRDRERSGSRDPDDHYGRPGYDRPPYDRTSLDRIGHERYNSPYSTLKIDAHLCLKNKLKALHCTKFNWNADISFLEKASQVNLSNKIEEFREIFYLTVERRGYPEDRGPPPAAPLPPPPPPPPRVEKKPEIKNIDDILKPPGRLSRPERVQIGAAVLM